jgi:hypothetical protein
LIDELQVDLDAWIRDYNEARPHQPLWRSTDPAPFREGGFAEHQPQHRWQSALACGVCGVCGVYLSALRVRESF